MWSQYYEATVSQLLRKSILLHCSENVPFEDKLEIDGIICISAAADGKQIVVKVHEVLESHENKSWELPLGASHYQDEDGASARSSSQTGSGDYDDVEGTVGTAGSSSQFKSESRWLGERAPSVAVENGTSVEYTVSGLADTRSDNMPEVAAIDEEHSQQQSKQEMDTRARLPCRNIFPLHRRDHHAARLPRTSQSAGEEAKEEQGELGVDSDVGQGEGFTRQRGKSGLACRACSLRFSNFASLNTHNYDTHCRFTCRQCLNTFSMMCNLRRHERLHVGRKPYTCCQCGKGFSRNSDLRLHTAKLHRNTSVAAAAASAVVARHTATVHRMGSARHLHRGIDGAHRKRKQPGALGDILTKLARRQLQSLRERSVTSSAYHSLAARNQTAVPSSSSSSSSSSTSSISSSAQTPHQCQAPESELGWDGACAVSNDGTLTGDVIEIKPEEPSLQEDVATTMTGQAGVSEGRVPLLLPRPVFSRSILKPAALAQMNTISGADAHLIDARNASGSRMKDTALSELTYEMPVEKNGSTEPADYEASTTVHGLSFGRIVFPEQTTVKSEVASSLSYSSDTSVTGLPFLTYSSRKPGRDLADGKPSREDGGTAAAAAAAAVRHSPSPAASSMLGHPRRSSPMQGEEALSEGPPLISLERRYWCSACMTRWESFASYEQHHVSQHLRYPCQFCEQTFSNKNNRSRHIRSHTGQKEHVCADCGKSFSRSDTLKEHQIIHTDGYLGDQCNHCHRVIKKKAELLAHIKKCAQKHRGRTSAAASPSSYSD